jgi:hypothetical protein
MTTEHESLLSSLGEAEKYAKELEARLAEREWRPIETAPKDGKQVLIYSGDRCDNCPAQTSGITVAFWEDGMWICGNMANGTPVYLKHTPSHWMPLPQPPAA